MPNPKSGNEKCKGKLVRNQKKKTKLKIGQHFPLYNNLYFLKFRLSPKVGFEWEKCRVEWESCGNLVGMIWDFGRAGGPKVGMDWESCRIW